MGEMLIQVTVLILAILAIRKVFGERLHVYIRYGLWALVVLRLVIPVNVVNSPLSLLHVVETVTEQAEESFAANAEAYPFKKLQKTANAETNTAGEKQPSDDAKAGTAETDNVKAGTAETDNVKADTAETDNVKADTAETDNVKADTAETDKTEAAYRKGNKEDLGSAPVPRLETRFVWKHGNMLRIVWVSGAALVGGGFCISYCSFRRRLKRTGKPVKSKDVKIPVYTVKNLESPCLTGLLRPTIYIPESMQKDVEKLQYALMHEWVHYLHKDFIWTFVRILLVIVYWFHPLVWAAASASVKDGELACDYGTVKRLGEEKRFAYGEMLLELAGNRKGKRLYACGTLMQPKKTEMKERICCLTGQRKSKRAVSIFTVLFALALTGCAFTGAEEKTGNESNSQESVSNEEKEKADELSKLAEELQQEQIRLQQEQEALQQEQEALKQAQNGAVQLEKKEAELSLDTPLGVDGPTLDYAGNLGESDRSIIIFHDYFGLIVYDISNQVTYRTLNLEEIGCHMTQGEDACQTAVSKDGKTVWLHPMSQRVMYRYEVEENLLYEETLVKTFEVDLEGKELFSNFLTPEDYALECWAGFRSNYLYEEYEDKKGTQQARIYLSANIVKELPEDITGEKEEEMLSLKHLQCVWSDMVFVLFPDLTALLPYSKPPAPLSEAGFPFTYDGVVQMVEIRYDTPCDYSRISNTFGGRTHPVTGETIVHEGIDFAAEEGTDIYAAANGVVYESGYDSEYGNYVVLLHSNGEFTYYCQCKEILVEEENAVKRGDLIAAVGNTGQSTGAHLHFALSRNGKFINPADYMELVLPIE